MRQYAVYIHVVCARIVSSLPALHQNPVPVRAR